LEPERFLRIFPIFVRIWVVLIVSATAFFYLNKNAALKRRVWLPFVVTTGALFIGFLWLMGTPLPFRLMGATAVIAAILINVRTVRFCEACGNMSRSRNSFAQPTVCSKCGAGLK
jgi:hypothetical protein